MLAKIILFLTKLFGLNSNSQKLNRLEEKENLIKEKIKLIEKENPSTLENIDYLNKE